jgi:hypothetical protein
MDSLINGNRRIRGTRSGIFILPLLLFLLFIGYPCSTFAGGCEIFEDSLSFDKDPQKRLFSPSTEIVFEFVYRDWTYSGKPNYYCVFELRKVNSSGVTSPPRYFVMPIHADYGPGSARFHLPEPESQYTISYHMVPFFSFNPLSNIHGGFITSQAEKNAIEKFYKENYAGTQELVKIQSTSGPATQTRIMTIYFVPSLKEKVDAAVAAGKPPTFEWLKGDDSASGVRDEEFSYRLSPHEDWSEYSTAKKTTYYLLTPGQYTFQVRGRYIIDGQRKETKVASLPFQVAQIISELPPADIHAGRDIISPQVLERYRYQKSRALLIRVSEYNDNTWASFPYVKQDLALMIGILQKHGFEIEVLDQDTSKERIEDALNKLLGEATRDDRVIVYISGHGTSEGLKNFIVPTDGNANMKASTCISYERLKQWTSDLMIKKKVKHILVIWDACKAGLGAYSKSDKQTPLADYLKYPSARLMTAGFMDQNAYVDPKTGASIFTQVLCEGLDGKAGPETDNVITLDDLYGYVARKVSAYVSDALQQKQVPQIINIGGVTGGMLFFIKRRNGD